MSDGKLEQSWWESRPPWVRISIIVGAVLVFILIWWLVPPLLYAATSDEAVRIKAITDTRTALLAGLVGIGALGTFWMNSRNVKLTAKTLGVSEANLRLAERSQKETFELTERGHLTDRYTKAIEQLGNDKLDVRLGGIYALEQLASDSEQARDQATIIEVLSAFVRVHSAPLYQYKASLPKDAQPEPAEEEHRKAFEYVNKLGRPPVDVQATVTVLGRLLMRSELALGRVDLSEAWLRRANLTGANLTKANLLKANLTEATLDTANLTAVSLTGADLTKATLNGSNLTKATLDGANLTAASLFRADLTGARLFRADLTGARLVGADLTEARLDKANLTKANLLKANLTETTLDEADLTGAHLDRANLTEASLIQANLTEAGLMQANLTKATLVEANLTAAHLDRANLTEADLAGADLTVAIYLIQEQVDVAFGDKDTLFPAGLRRPESWNRGEAPEPR